ncbi:DUF126 domain-containing protein [Salicibibacter cibarius]|uniref:DUF126 domain-containing protein n=1 Tax=Salicibibacter cibarius TaxID=2743000 RepID=A0A7T6Z6U2_9BACI|nr:DUF126 domain-containing protein [Salicibibacter cibarius]QQK77742.1 DUF126 domain-containing protein [Salicibibacter cibarius]
MIKIRGAPLVQGKGEGNIIGTTKSLSFWGGFDPSSGKIVDRHHPLHGHKISGEILALPSGRGSSSGSGVLLEAIMENTAPSAIVINKPDEIISLGAIVCDEIFVRQLPILVLDNDSFNLVLNASYARIDGEVIVLRS